MGSDLLVPVSQVIEIVLGGTPKRSEKAYWGGAIKWASAKDITGVSTRYIYDTEERITELGLEESNTKLLPKDTIVITARGTVGAMAMLGEDMAFNQSCYGLVSKNKIDPKYLYYALKSSLSKIASVSYGTVFDTITMKSFDSIEIPLPFLEEQKRIAHILGTFDDKIELNQRMNQTLEAIARAVFKSWFVDFDPVCAKMAGEPFPLPDEIMALFPDELVESELGMIPKGWEVGTIDKIAKVMIGGDWGKEEKTNDYNYKVRCLRGTDLELLRKYGYSSEIPIRWIKRSSYKKRSLDEFDVIVAASGVGPLGRPLWVNPWIWKNYDEPFTYSNFTKRIRAKTKALAIYLDRILNDMRVSEKIWEFSTGTSIPNLDIHSLVTNHLVLLPEDETVNFFAKQVMPYYKHLYSDENQVLSKMREEYSHKFFDEI